MRSKNVKFIITLLIFLCSVPVGSHASIVVGVEGKKMVLQAQDVLLGDLLKEISRKYEVEVLGLDHREKEEITFSTTGRDLQDVIKRLLRYLGEENCAFEFTDVKLTRVSVLPSSKSRGASFSASTKKRPAPKKFGNVVQVKRIINGSQAEELDLQEGDLIIEYDGVKISSAQQLVKEVKKKSDMDQVEMRMVREGQPSQHLLRGGKIGVQIITTRIPKEELDGYF